MGVEARIVMFAPDRERAEEAARAAYARIAELEQAYSDYRPTSELMTLCAGPVGEPQALGPDLARLLPIAAKIGADSGGAFDVTIGPLVRLWREARRTGEMPEVAALMIALHQSGWAMMELSDGGTALTLREAGMGLDLGGIGKGDAAQQAVEVLRARGVDRCMVGLAGDIAAGAPPPRARAWVVDASPRVEARAQVRLRGSAVSTSGDASQFVEIGGVRYSHIVDPRTGVGVTNRQAAMVVASRGEIADALASALCVLDVAEAEGLIRKYPDAGAVVWLAEEAGGGCRVIDPHGVLEGTLTLEPATEGSAR